MKLSVHIYTFLILTLVIFSAIQCQRKLTPTEKQKIRFDYSAIDDSGLRNGEVAVDYEFCIPAHDNALHEVSEIAPGVRVMKHSKGRVRCSDTEWLCIINTHDPGWRRILYAIASLPYVVRMEETFYE
jgi:hypothetical protein